MIVDTLKLINNPDVLGELLRDLAFKPVRRKDNTLELGCYNHFEVKDEWKAFKLSNVEDKIQKVMCDELGFDVLESQSFTIYSHSAENIFMTYFWDGDGTLLFILPNGTVCSNQDCKKNYNWSVYEI